MKATATTSTPAKQQPSTTSFFDSQKSEGQFFGENQVASDEFFPVQTKLSIGSPNDKYEQEADATADRVIQNWSSDNGTSKTSDSINTVVPNIQNKDDEDLDKKEDEIDTKRIDTKLQRKPIFESDADTSKNNHVQARLATIGVQRKKASSSGTSSSVESGISSSKGSGAPIDTDTRMKMESNIGADFSGVKIHTGTDANRMNKDLGAQAFTHGSDIYFGEGKYDTQSSSGRHLLAHELTHTVQQGAAIQRKPEISSTSLTVQTFPGEDSVRDWMGDKADKYIPAYPLLSVVIGYDLIRGENVSPTRDNILKGVFSIINPIGSIIYTQLKERGIIDEAFGYINGQIEELGLTYTQLKQTWSSFWDATDLLRTDPFDYNYSLFKRYFGGFFSNLVTLATRIKDKVFEMVKNAFLKVLGGLAKKIGGYDLLADLIGFDPVTEEERNATTADILRGILKLPIIQSLGGDKLLAKLEEHNLIEKAATWIDMQWTLLKGAFTNLLNLGSKFLSLFTFETLSAPMEFVNGVVEEVVGFVTKIITFFKNLATEVLRLIKEVLILLLKTFVGKNTPGYDLVSVLLGKDPITGEIVKRNAKNIIKGFLGLIPGGASLFAKFEETGAIDRITQWINGAVAEFIQILIVMKDAVLNLWKTSKIEDLFEPIPFFTRIVDIFTQPVLRVVAFVKRVVTKIFEVLLQIMKFPIHIAKSIIANIKKAFASIKRDPIGFLMRMLGAVKEGFVKFFNKIGEHLLAGVSGWLFGQVAKAGITPPKDLSFSSILGLVMDILGLTIDNLWKKLADKIGQDKVDKIKAGIDKVKGIWLFVKDVMQNGITAVWSYIQEKISNLWTIVVEEVSSWVITKIISQVTTKLLSFLDPTGIMAVVNGFIAFFNAIQSFMEQFQKMLEIVNTFVGGIAEVASGSISKAAGFLESALAKSLPVAISFLANQVGLGKVGDKLAEIVGKVRGVVDGAIDWLLTKAMAGIQSIIGLFGGGKKDKSKEKEKEDENVDPEVAKKVADGLTSIPEKEKLYLTNGKMTREEAELVAADVKKEHPVFKVFKVVDGTDSWDYYYKANPEGPVESSATGKEEGETKENKSLPDKAPSFPIGSMVRVHQGKKWGIGTFNGYEFNSKAFLKNKYTGWMAIIQLDNLTVYKRIEDFDKENGWNTYTTGIKQIVMNDVDALGRSTGVSAKIGLPLEKGTNASVKPVGLVSGIHVRGHLLGKQFGGSGSDPRNITALFIKTNDPRMKKHEMAIRKIIDSGEIVDYSITPIYIGKNPIPASVQLIAFGDSGYKLNINISNTP